MAGDRLTRILAVFSADILSLCFQAPSFVRMCVVSMARLLISPVPHSRCALWSLRRSKIPLDMAHFAQFDPPIPTQVAAIASAFPSASWGGWAVWGGVPQRRFALLLLSRSRFLSCGPFVFLTYLTFPCFAPMTLLLHRRGLCQSMLTLHRWPLVGPARWLAKTIIGRSWTRSSKSRVWCTWGHACHAVRLLEITAVHVTLLGAHSRCPLVWSCLGPLCAVHVRRSFIATCASV